MNPNDLVVYENSKQYNIILINVASKNQEIERDNITKISYDNIK